MAITDSFGVAVSVAITTYNHELFIAAAVESALRQQTDFAVELVIGEDCSTDGTRAVVQSYAARFPERIRILPTERNRGMLANYGAVLNACRGRYVALLDGDDYWTDASKLQRQVGLLEDHPQMAICFHDVLVVDEDQRYDPVRYCSPQQKEISTLEDLLIQNFIPACACVFRRGLFGELPPWIFALPWFDWPLHILNAQYGCVGYIAQVMGVNRVHSSNVSWSWKSLRGRRASVEGRILMYRSLARHLDRGYRRLIRRQLASAHYQLAAIESCQGSRLGALQNLVLSIGLEPTVSCGALARKLVRPRTFRQVR